MTSAASIQRATWHGLGACAIVASAISLGTDTATTVRVIVLGWIAQIAAHAISQRWALLGSSVVGAPLLALMVLAVMSKRYTGIPYGLVAFLGITVGSLATFRPPLIELVLGAGIVVAFVSFGTFDGALKAVALVGIIVFTCLLAVLVRSRRRRAR